MRENWHGMQGGLIWQLVPGGHAGQAQALQAPQAVPVFPPKAAVRARRLIEAVLLGQRRGAAVAAGHPGKGGSSWKRLIREGFRRQESWADADQFHT